MASRTTAPGKRPESDLAVHPGALLAEELEARGMTQRALAEAMGRPAQAINEIVRGKKSIAAETALQLERVLGIAAYLWLRLQARYDLATARKRELATARQREAVAPAGRALRVAEGLPRPYRPRQEGGRR